MTISPHMRFYVARNPKCGMPIEPVDIPSREDFDAIRQYEPTQIVQSYEYWAEDIVRRETESREQTANCFNIIHKVDIMTEEDITRTEQLDNFLMWTGTES